MALFYLQGILADFSNVLVDVPGQKVNLGLRGNRKRVQFVKRLELWSVLKIQNGLHPSDLLSASSRTLDFDKLTETYRSL